MSLSVLTYTVETRPSTTWDAIAANNVLDVSGVAEGGGSRDNGMASGADSTQRVTVVVRRTALPTVADRLRVRVSYTVTDALGTRNGRAFVGVVVGVTWDHEQDAWSLTCEGLQTLLRTVRAYSPPFYRTPIARKTTAASPTDAATAGISPLEWLLLTAGGWPAPRDVEAPHALFYYDLDHALFAPDWAWFAGEDGWAEALRLVRAAGGQLYFSGDGVLRYRQPLSWGDVAAGWALTDTGTPGATTMLYGRLDYSRSDRKVFERVRCTFVERRALPLQDVAEDTTARYVPAGELVEIPLEPQHPLNSLETSTGVQEIRAGGESYMFLPASGILALYLDGLPVPQGAGGYTHTVLTRAQRLVVQITNAGTRPFVVYRIAVRGEPIGPGATGSVLVGTGGDETSTLTIEDNPFIQRHSHAEALGGLYLAFDGPARPTLRATGCVLNPELDVGDAITLTSTPLALVAVRCAVIGVSHQISGTADYDLVRVDDLLALSDMITVGTTDHGGTGRRPGY
jgi:hypothetical protein